MNGIADANSMLNKLVEFIELTLFANEEFCLKAFIYQIICRKCGNLHLFQFPPL